MRYNPPAYDGDLPKLYKRVQKHLRWRSRSHRLCGEAKRNAIIDERKANRICGELFPECESAARLIFSRIRMLRKLLEERR